MEAFLFFVPVASLIGLVPPTGDPPAPPVEEAKKSSPVRDFAPGVRIDWSGRTVEVDARVALREGPLELLACSPETREHESVLVVEARPLHIFQAMGLVGLEPGAPPHYDELGDRRLGASGDALELRIQCGGGRPVSASAWMLDVATRKPPQRLDWVFAGSRALAGGRFGADADGTVACVVDFDTALIALRTSHSADNEELWLEANPGQVPPRGTRCRLLVGSVYHPKLTVVLGAAGALRVDGRTVSARELVELLRPVDHRIPQLTIEPAPKLDLTTFTAEVDGLRRRITEASFDCDIQTRLHPSERPATTSDPPALPGPPVPPHRDANHEDRP